MSDAVILTGISETIEELKKFDKQAVKDFDRVVKEVLVSAKSDAIALVPETVMSGWQKEKSVHPHKRTRGGAGWPAWNKAEVQKGIVGSRTEGKVSRDYSTSVASLKNNSAAGVIFELAGRRKGKSTLSDKRGSGEQFKRTIANRFGKPSRLVWRAVDNHREIYRRLIIEALENAKAELQKHLDSRG